MFIFERRQILMKYRKCKMSIFKKFLSLLSSSLLTSFSLDKLDLHTIQCTFYSGIVFTVTVKFRLSEYNRRLNDDAVAIVTKL